MTKSEKQLTLNTELKEIRISILYPSGPDKCEVSGHIDIITKNPGAKNTAKPQSLFSTVKVSDDLLIELREAIENIVTHEEIQIMIEGDQ